MQQTTQTAWLQQISDWIRRAALMGLVSGGLVSLVGCVSQQGVTKHDSRVVTAVAKTSAKPLFSAPDAKGVKQLNCAALHDNQVVRIRSSVAFKAGCQPTAKNVTFEMDRGNASLDCKGATLRATSKFRRSAILVRSDKGIANLRIANCHVVGYGHALHILQKTNPRTRYLRGEKNPDALRKKAPHHIHVRNLSSKDSITSAIFIGDHVHHVTMDQLHIENAGTVGVYFEFGSRHNVVKNSTFTNNGHRRFKPDREAIAIDSSQYNRIENNRFSKNGAGAVFLYRNCFEHAADTSKGNHFLRTESSDYNTIINNEVHDEEVGVWVASRQSRDLSGFKCGAYQMKKTTFATYHEDAAEHNLIQGNSFNDVEQSIIVEDDNNRVTGNTFLDVDQPAIMVGSAIKASTKLGAVKHVKVANNQFNDCRNCELDDVIRYRASKPFGQCGNVIVNGDRKNSTVKCN